MSARANAPVFQLHPSATSLGSPPTIPMTPASAPVQGPPSHGFTATNAPQLIPHPPLPGPLQQHQPPPPPPPGPNHSYHQRTESGSSQGRRRNSSFSRRRADVRARSSVPPQLGPTLPQIQPQSEADLISGALTAPVPDYPSSLKRENEGAQLGEPFGKRRREEEGGNSGRLRAEAERRSQTGRSPDRSSQCSGSGSVRSVKRGSSNEPEQTTT
jgi:hypothetical protein